MMHGDIPHSITATRTFSVVFETIGKDALK